MSYLRCLCLFAHSRVFLVCLSSFCVPYVASFSGLPILDCPFDILYAFISDVSSSLMTYFPFLCLTFYNKGDNNDILYPNML